MSRGAALLLVLATQLPLPTARAAEPPDAAALEEAKGRFAAGQKKFESGDLKGAVEDFKEAYRLTRNPLLLYNIAFVYDKLDDAPLALHYYSKFIDEAGDTERTHAQLAEASTRSAELRARLSIEEPPAPPPSEPASQPARLELQHEPIDQAPPGQPIDVTVRVPHGVPWTVTLHYRAPGQDLYQPVRMKPRPGAPAEPGGTDELVARIPAGATRGSALHYHVAARDPDGKLVGFSGKPQTPNIIYLDPAAPPHHYLEPGATPAAPAAPPVAAAPRAPSPPTRPLTYAKWAVSGGGLALVGTGVALNLLARDYADTLQTEARKSTTEDCSDGEPRPCRIYSAQRKDLESRGQSFERWSNITLIAGAATVLAAGALWYFDARAAVVPVVGREQAGVAAAWRF